MKSLLILFCLMSLQAFSLTNFEEELSSNDEYFQHSKNYTAIYTNDDATISIIEPRFSDPTGKGEKSSISVTSSKNGVCNLFGFSSFIRESSVPYEDIRSKRSVVISVNGSFESFADTRRTSSIKSLACRTGKRPAASKRANKIVTNDDESTTIYLPMFRFSGKNHWISNLGSSWDGVCRLYGYTKHVPKSIINFYSPDQKERSVIISSDGRFNDYTKTDKSGPDTIKSIICK